MQSTNTPPKILTPIAQQDGSRATVPLTTSDATRASQTQGFPPLTGQPPEAGGVPPQLPDMNGLLNGISGPSWWVGAGGRYIFDATFAANAAINGYPRGAALASADLTGGWLSTVDNNSVNPDTVGTGWVPGYHYGATTLAGLTGGTLTLTPAQAAKPVLRIRGVLATNLIVEMPPWVREWTVYNDTTGAFSVSLRTPGRPSVTVPRSSTPSVVRGDGTDVAVSSFDVPAASTTVAGITRLATTAEAAQGSSQAIAVTPLGLTNAVPGMVPTASATVVGKIRIATLPEQAAYTLSTVAVTPQGLGVAINTRAATVHTHDAADIVSGTLPIARGGTGFASLDAVSYLRTNASGTAIGFLTPAQVLSNIGGASTGANTFSAAQSAPSFDASTGIFSRGTDGPMYLRPNGASSAVGQVVLAANGNVTVAGAVIATGGFQGSSRTVKDHIRTVPPSEAMSLVESIEAVTYQYKPEYRDDGDRRTFGFIAEDLRELLPEVVRESDGKSPLVVEHAQLSAVLWAALQHLSARVRELEDR